MSNWHFEVLCAKMSHQEKESPSCLLGGSRAVVIGRKERRMFHTQVMLLGISWFSLAELTVNGQIQQLSSEKGIESGGSDSQE